MQLEITVEGDVVTGGNIGVSIMVRLAVRFRLVAMATASFVVRMRGKWRAV